MNPIMKLALGLLLTLIFSSYYYTTLAVDKAEVRVTERLQVIEQDIKELLRRVR